LVLDESETNPWTNAGKLANLYLAHENGFGCVQNQSYRKMAINLPILAVMKMVLDASKTNP
jgi:hypothetical protein